MILVTAKISEKYHKDLIQAFPNETFTFCDDISQATDELPQAEIIVTYGEDLTDEHIEKASQLKWIMVLSAGVDQLPHQAIKKHHILVTNVRGIHKIPMAEYAIAMLLQVYRQAKTLIKHQMEGKWERSIKMQEISARTMVILGTGAIGQEVARLAKAFHIKTIGVSRSGKPVEFFDETYQTSDLHQQLPDADFVVSVLPSTPETKYLFTEESFRLLPNHAVFLNMGRGDIVKSDVLLQAIQNKEIAHAVLDVFEEEPLPENHPLWQEENITITPHLSGISPQYVPRALNIFKENLNKYRGKEQPLINEVDVSRGY
ncbi:MAG TPA: D-2-hydroxyacid dehydrogenase [Cerasibacillus sp.]|uniref:D-2-hydroxyacid dehydrogenase n=1 Tax=Cerasibacillus sp. TaxID=2498711 RepID=UPI002F3F6EBD